MEVQIISQEYIKPSSPTPPHLNTYKFSLLDHLMPPVYIPMVLFYPHVSSNNTTQSGRSQALKQSLSETLTRFYPLAGRIRNNLYIDCNDEGAYYIEAKVESYDLSEFLQQPDLTLLPKLVPPYNSLLDYTSQLKNHTTSSGAEVVMVQVTDFPCGGFVVGAYVSHMIVDGVTISTFLQAWAASAAQIRLKGECVPLSPNFDGAASFPPMLDEQGKIAHPREATMRGLYRRFAKRGRCVNKRFFFEASAVAKLKELAAMSSLQKPSRVEAVSAFLWKCSRAAWKAKSGGYAPSLITHAVNLRRRAEPNLPQNFMGNYVCLAGAVADDQHGKEEEAELSSLVGKMREATSRFNGDLVAKLQGENRMETMSKIFQDMAEAIEVCTNKTDDNKAEMNFIGFTSIAYSGVYNADFGWGKPSWVAPVHEPCHEAFSVNVIRLLDTGEWGNNGIEAWISLAEEEMTLLEKNKDLLAFASPNPSITLK